MTMFKETGIRQQVIEEIIQIAKLNHVEKVILFGSRARGDYKERSELRPNANITRRPCVVTCPAIWIRLLITVRILRRLTGCLLLGARLLFSEA